MLEGTCSVLGDPKADVVVMPEWIWQICDLKEQEGGNKISLIQSVCMGEPGWYWQRSSNTVRVGSYSFLLQQELSGPLQRLSADPRCINKTGSPRCVMDCAAVTAHL